MTSMYAAIHDRNLTSWQIVSPGLLASRHAAREPAGGGGTQPLRWVAPPTTGRLILMWSEREPGEAGASHRHHGVTRCGLGATRSGWHPARTFQKGGSSGPPAEAAWPAAVGPVHGSSPKDPPPLNPLLCRWVRLTLAVA